MTKTKLITKTKVITKKCLNNNLAIILLLANIIFSNVVIAQDYTSVSFGSLSVNKNNDLSVIIAEENINVATPEQYLGQTPEQVPETTRIERLSKQRESMSHPTPITRSNNYHNDVYADFAIYNATTLLQDDYDHDGFYKTFSVIFDADIYSYSPNPLGEVYALLYISKNGGPWIHYFTTDIFFIEGNSDLDKYEVMTSFLSGYPSDHYDILIDLYQVGYTDIVASHSSYDSNDLYALPLESEDYDEPHIEPYVEVITVGHGGGFSINLILLFLLVYSVRTLHIKR